MSTIFILSPVDYKCCMITFNLKAIHLFWLLNLICKLSFLFLSVTNFLCFWEIMANLWCFFALIYIFFSSYYYCISVYLNSFCRQIEICSYPPWSSKRVSSKFFFSLQVFHLGHRYSTMNQRHFRSHIFTQASECV